MKKRSTLFIPWLLVLSLSFYMLSSVPVFAAGKEVKLPRVLNMATMPPGMIVNAQAVGIADIISKYTPMSVKVIPATNEMVWMPMTITKEVDLGVAGAVAVRQANLGTFVFKDIAKKAKVKNFPMRLILVGSPLRVNIFVRGDDPAKKISDLKGRRMIVFREGTHFYLYQQAKLANAGLTYDDVIKVPASNPIEATRAVIEGRADAAALAVGAPIEAEAVAKVKARYLPLDPSPEAVKRMKAVIDTAYVAKVPGGIFIGVPEDQYLMHLDTVLVARGDVSKAAVYEIVKTLYDRNAELLKRPGLMEWSVKRFVSKEPRIPFHDGAIRYYKEKGFWTKDMDDWQKAVLAEEPN